LRLLGKHLYYVHVNIIELENGRSPVPRRAGRPTKFNDATLDRLSAALADGMSIKSACVVAGIGVATLSEWRDEHPELDDRLAESRECARQKALQAIKAAGEKDWRAHAEWLRLSFPGDYRGNANKVEVNAIATAASPIVLTEEERLELIERQRVAEVLTGEPGEDSAA
jgi:hypothetical protein